ncbi:MAG TPA: nucleotidyltransferase family protein [Candidatus Hydrogenedentes bacterium]|nr:nucleotidyltransferase family protein [Candidatus Hydrogenedentota bacterium]
MSTQELIQHNREEILRISAKHKANNIRIFGSVARGDENTESDVDFLVSFNDEVSLLDHAALIVDLEDLLGKKVDVIPDTDLREHIRERVLSEAKAI